MQNGVLLMGGSALAALAYTRGNVTTLVIMYSINVFLTFSLSMLGMCRHWLGQRGQHALWRRRLALFAGGGTRPGQIIGATDASASAPTSDPVSIADFLRTMYTILGIDPDKEYPDPLGRPVPIVGGGKVIPGLLV